MDLTIYLILLSISFAAAVIGTIAGMAMLIMPPVMLFMGIPIHTAIATGRFSMLGITAGNIAAFTREGRIQGRYVLAFGIFGTFGALCTASFLLLVSEKLLITVIGAFMIMISLIVFFEDRIKKFIGAHHASGPSIGHHAISAVAGFILGAYIGIIGGGAGTLLIFLLVLIYGLSFHDAVANQKMITLPISIVATAVFIIQGSIDYSLAIPLFVVNIFGGMIGAKLVNKVSPTWLKRILVPLMVALGIKMLFFT